jgi:hypothetical protein
MPRVWTVNDPHVETLSYDLWLREPQARFNSPPPVVAPFEGFVVSLEDERATVTMTAHCADVDEARALVEPTLASWEASAALQGRRIAFKFSSAGLVDRDPPAGAVGPAFSDYLVNGIGLTGSIEEEMLVGLYPPPPVGFVATPHVRTLLDRYEGYVEWREPLPAFSWFVLSYVTKLLAPTRAAAAQQLNIDEAVLRQLGFLCSAVGTAQTARKIDRAWAARPHGDDEWQFMEAATKALMRRVGEAAAQPPSSLTRLTSVTTPRT